MTDEQAEAPMTVDALAWSLRDLPEALREHSDHTVIEPSNASWPPSEELDLTDPSRLVAAIAARLGWSAHGCELAYGGLARVVATDALIVAAVPEPAQDPRVLVFQRQSSRALRVYAPSRPLGVSVPTTEVARILQRQAEQPFAQDIARMLTDVAPTRHQSAYDSILRSILGSQPIASMWLLRPRQTHTGTRAVLAEARTGRQLTVLAALHVGAYSAFIAAWAMLGAALLSGQLDRGRLVAAWLLFASHAVLTTWGNRVGLHTGISFGASLKRWLLSGAIRLDDERARRFGAGYLVGLVLESATIHHIGLEGALAGVFAGIEIVAAALILVFADGGLGPFIVLSLVTTIGGFSVRRLARRRRAWIEARIAMSCETVEVIVGHRTRLAQSVPEHWHAREEILLDRYRVESEALDRAHLRLRAIVARAFLPCALLAMLPAVLAGDGNASPAAVLGAIVLAHRALQRAVMSAVGLTNAAATYAQLTPLLDTQAPTPLVVPRAVQVTPGIALMEAHNLAFRYADAKRAAVQDASLNIAPGDRLLLEAPSGAGKSTLAALLAGLRRPSQGVLLFCGLDIAGLGESAWRRRVALVPQFHENHILSGTVAFNALLGRGWPASPAELAEAQEVLTALGLGPVLAAMPSGMMQAIGEIGWRLSHGERSRLFLARALLQRADIIIADESFGALDPDTLRTCLRYVSAQKAAVVLLAHR